MLHQPHDRAERGGLPSAVRPEQRHCFAPADVKRVYDMLFGGRDPVAEPGTATGTPGNWWTVFALVPDCFRHAVAGFGLIAASDISLSRHLLGPRMFPPRAVAP